MTVPARESPGAPASTLLSALLVAEVGERIGAGACGSLLAQLGADVVLIEPVLARTNHKWNNRALVAAGKRSLAIDMQDAADAELIDHVLRGADVVLLSSDVTTAADHDWRDDQIVCDITAFGDSGPLSGLAYSDAMVQAVSGIVDTTGSSDRAPVPVGFPILEYCAGIYAAAAIIVALRVRRLHQRGQAIDIALFDCAMSTMSTFLPFHMIGKPVTRAGNRHALAAPWNAYRAADGWVLICTATDEQWRRLCVAMGQPELERAGGCATNAERVAHCSEIDALVQKWVQARTVGACVDSLLTNDIPCGPIATVAQFADEPNLRHRRMIHRLVDPVSRRELVLPGTPLKASRTGGQLPQNIPVPGADHEQIRMLCRSSARPETASGKPAPSMPPPLAGLKVVEIGQYTTAPLVARQLGALGADVLKIEPPGGEGARNWPPLHGDRGYFFTFSNSDKKSLMLDLRDARGKAAFSELLKSADVLVENLKPGSLSRLGFSPAALETLNSRLVYCSISGFGADSAYPERPAFDTVVQAMSGFMDLTRADGTPTKAGISAADIVGGTYSLHAILAALEFRDRAGRGQHLDISMQDVACWVTQTAWNTGTTTRANVIACSDGYVLVEGDITSIADRLAKRDARFAAGLSAASNYTRAAFEALASGAGVITAPVLTVSEAADSPQSAARQLIVYGVDSDGTKWPLLNSPLRLKATPPRVTRPIGQLGEANSELIQKIQR